MMLGLPHVTAHMLAVIALALAIWAVVKAYADASSSDIAEGAVTTAKLEGFAVNADKLAEGAVTASKLAVDAVGADALDETASYAMVDLSLTGKLTRYRMDVEFVPTGVAKTLVANDSGKTFVLDNTTPHALTLPAVASSKGWNARFVVGTDVGGGDITILTPAGDAANLMRGHAVGLDGDAGTTSTGFDLITFVHGAGVAGDFLDLVCDGVKWYVSGETAVAAGILFA